MWMPFQAETFSQERFLRHEVRYNLLYRIAEGECAAAMQTQDGGAVALQSQGRGMWLWIDPEMGHGYAASATEELAGLMRGSRLPGVTAAPADAERFIAAYTRVANARPRLDTRLMAYACSRVKPPIGVPGVACKADVRHVETVAQLRAGFVNEIFGTASDGEAMLRDAANLIQAGGMYLWAVDGHEACMTAIGHRTQRYARINNVYTAREMRKRGYASALVAHVSQLVLDEGLTPMLYADSEYPASNGVYRGIGYVEAGRADEYSFIYDEQ